MSLFSKKKHEEEKQASAVAEPSEVKTTGSLEMALSLPLLLVQPRISEKAGALAKINKYVFVVKKKANKVEVKKAVESKYKVRVLRMNMLNTQGKTKTFGRTIGRTSGFKKAIVTLKKGDKIEGLTDVV